MESRQPADAVLHETLMLIPQHQITSIQSMRSPYLPLTGDTIVTDEGILIFEMWCLKAIKLISCDIQRNCISSFEKLHVFHVFMREYSVVIFAKDDF